MSQANVEEFISLVEKDPGLQAQLKSLPRDNGEEARQAILSIAREKGLEFSDDDVSAVKAGKKDFEEGELTDNEAENVSGGWWIFWWW